jgi:hypothetical protein
MPTSTKAERKLLFAKLAANVGSPAVSFMAGAPVAPSTSSVAVARSMVGTLTCRANTEQRVSRLATKLDRLVELDRRNSLPRRANGNR